MQQWMTLSISPGYNEYIVGDDVEIYGANNDGLKVMYDPLNPATKRLRVVAQYENDPANILIEGLSPLTIIGLGERPYSIYLLED